MIKFSSLQAEAKRQGFTIEREDFLFALFVVLGYKLDECAILSGKYNPREKPITRGRKKKEPLSNSNAVVKAKKTLDEDNIKWLVMTIKPFYLEDTKGYVFEHMDEFDFIPQKAKQNLVDQSLINKLIDSEEEELTFDEVALRGIKKNIMAILKSDISVEDKSQVDSYLKTCSIALQRLLPPPKDEEISYFDKNFQYVYPKFNAICPVCSKEIDVARGLINICSHCKAKIDLTEK